MTFTYVVTSYRDPPQIYRLVGTIRRSSPRAMIVVSHDLKGPALDYAVLRRHQAELLATPGPITWGDDTYLLSILEAFSNLRLAQTDWVTLLTAQDYPLRPLDQFERHLTTVAADALLEPTVPDDPLLGRYRHRVLRLPRWTGSRGRYGRGLNLLPGVNFQLQPHGARPIAEVPRFKRLDGDGLRLHRGCDLYTLNGRALSRLLSAPPEILDYFRKTSIPSEGFPHTVLRSDPRVRVRDEQIHYMKWRASAHPELLDSSDLSTLRSSSTWFARKFLSDDPALDVLDGWIDG